MQNFMKMSQENVLLKDFADSKGSVSTKNKYFGTVTCKHKVAFNNDFPLNSALDTYLHYSHMNVLILWVTLKVKNSLYT